MSLRQYFLNSQIRIVSGKGGVGKSTMVMALADLASFLGLRVLVCELAGIASVAERFDLCPVGTEITQVRERLWMVRIEPQAAIQEYARMKIQIKSLYQATFENRFVRYFFEAVPALAQFVTLGKIWFHHQERHPSDTHLPKYDLILVDAPSSGHALSLLQTPQTFMQMIDAGPFYQSAKDFKAMLENPNITRLDLVTLLEEMPVSETIDMYQKIKTQKLCSLGVLMINKVLSDLPDWVPDFLNRSKTELSSSLEYQQLCSYLSLYLNWHQSACEHMQRLITKVPLPVVKIERLQWMPTSSGTDQISLFSRAFEQACANL